MQDNYQNPNIPQYPFALTLTSTSNAKADGYATNSATALLLSQGAPLCGYNVTFSVSGSALFCDGGNQTCAVTDAQGRATVYFTDRCVETVWVNCQYENLTSSSNSTFQILEEISDIKLIAEVTRDRATANSGEANSIAYLLENVRLGTPLPYQLIDVFADSPTAILPPLAVTDANGRFNIAITDARPGEVEIATRLQGDSAVTNYTVVVFTPPITHIISVQQLTGTVYAGGAHRLLYTLRRVDGTLESNAIMAFEVVEGTAALEPDVARTDINGRIELSVIAVTPQTVTINALYAVGDVDDTRSVVFLAIPS